MALPVPTNEEFISFMKGVIEEFRANGGIVTVPDFRILLLTTTGVRSGLRRTVPLAFGVEGDRVFVVASKGGAPKHPDWFRNLLANPSVTVELGPNVFEATAEIVQGAERDRLYPIIAGNAPVLNDYEENTNRVFPIVVLRGVTPPDPGQYS